MYRYKLNYKVVPNDLIVTQFRVQFGSYLCDALKKFHIQKFARNNAKIRKFNVFLPPAAEHFAHSFVFVLLLLSTAALSNVG